ncbi:hypothetical protein M2345_001794 [Sphingobium sp. B8D3D]|nr:hypothetical protein [Sphingobium sp. B8D3D]
MIEGTHGLSRAVRLAMLAVAGDGMDARWARSRRFGAQ